MRAARRHRHAARPATRPDDRPPARGRRRRSLLSARSSSRTQHGAWRPSVVLFPFQLTRAGHAHGKARQVEQMIECAEQACATDPTYYGGYCVRARVLAQQGQLNEALADFELANDLAVGEGKADESEALFGLQGFLHNFPDPLTHCVGIVFPAQNGGNFSPSKLAQKREPIRCKTSIQMTNES